MNYTLNHGSTMRVSYSLNSLPFFEAKPLLHKAPSVRLLSDVIDDYVTSPEWLDLADSTRKIWILIVNRILDRWGATPIELWSNPEHLMAIIRWRNENAHMPRTADHQLTVLHHYLAWARLHGEVVVNLAAGIPRLYKTGNRAEIIWHEEEIAEFCAAAPQPVADGMRLAALTGLRRADLVGLSWSEIDHIKIARVTLPRCGSCSMSLRRDHAALAYQLCWFTLMATAGHRSALAMHLVWSEISLMCGTRTGGKSISMMCGERMQPD